MPMQLQDPTQGVPVADPAPWWTALEAVSLVDWTAIAVLAVFFVLGLFRGLVWQVARIASLLLSYAAACIWGKPLAHELRGWFPDGTDESVRFYVAAMLLFVAVMIVVSVFALLIQRLMQGTVLRFYDRVAGGVLGVATGALVCLAGFSVLFGVMHALGSTDGNIVQAAERSRSLQFGHTMLRAAADALPPEWRAVPEEWSALLRDPAVVDDGRARTAADPLLPGAPTQPRREQR